MMHRDGCQNAWQRDARDARKTRARSCREAMSRPSLVPVCQTRDEKGTGGGDANGPRKRDETTGCKRRVLGESEETPSRSGECDLCRIMDDFLTTL